MEEKRKFIALASGKGGTGKTVSSLNLGMALHKLGESVLVIDGDLEDPNIGINLGIHSPKATFNEALEEEIRLLEALYVHESGLRLIPSSLSINYLNSTLDNVEEVLKDTKGYVILDCGPGLNDHLINILEACDSLIAVTNPIRSSISGTLRLIELAKDLDKEIEGVIINQITSQGLDQEEIEQVTGQPILGKVPYDQKVDESIAHKQPLVDYKPYSPAAVAYRKIAHNMVDQEYEEGIRDRFKRYYHLFLSRLGL